MAERVHTFGSLGERNNDRPGLGGVTKPIIHPLNASRKRGARVRAVGPGAEGKVGCRLQTGGIRGRKASSVPVVHGALSAASLTEALAAVDDTGDQNRLILEGAGHVVDGANEGELSVGSGEPVIKLGIGHDSVRGLK